MRNRRVLISAAAVLAALLVAGAQPAAKWSELLRHDLLVEPQTKANRPKTFPDCRAF